MQTACSFRSAALAGAPVRPQQVRSAAPVSVQAKAVSRKEANQERHRRLRLKLSGTTERPRLAVFRSNQHIYAQVIDDTLGRTLVSCNTLQAELKSAVENKTANTAAAEAVGKKIAELCATKSITKVSYDRGGFLYHGRIQAVADAAREAGLQF